uniref:Uncharacterized protein n=1 Tax=Rousettus aegyptiacus TaxID=9407 RepID=A0A7J8F027_ROUAE|nr:hypothetical protein HJG63_012242 [Rousettus aegyptiacus]
MARTVCNVKLQAPKLGKAGIRSRHRGAKTVGHGGMRDPRGTRGSGAPLLPSKRASPPPGHPPEAQPSDARTESVSPKSRHQGKPRALPARRSLSEQYLFQRFGPLQATRLRGLPPPCRTETPDMLGSH